MLANQLRGSVGLPGLRPELRTPPSRFRKGSWTSPRSQSQKLIFSNDRSILHQNALSVQVNEAGDFEGVCQPDWVRRNAQQRHTARVKKWHLYSILVLFSILVLLHRFRTPVYLTRSPWRRCRLYSLRYTADCAPLISEQLQNAVMAGNLCDVLRTG